MTSKNKASSQVGNKRSKYSVHPSFILDLKDANEPDAEEIQKYNLHNDHIRARILSLFLGRTGLVIDVLSTSLSVTSCIIYVWQTYDNLVTERLQTFEIFLCAVFLLEYLLRGYVSKDRVRYILSWHSSIDILTVLPVIIFISDNSSGDTYELLSGLRVLRIFRLLRVHRVINYIQQDDIRAVLKFVLNLGSFLFIGAAFIQQLENNSRESYFEPLLSFGECLYLTVVTISTVGYGDVYPVTGLGKVFMITLIMFALIFIPWSTSNLLKHLNEKSVFASRRYRPIEGARHVVLIGDIRADSAEEFFREFFHPDHRHNLDVSVVILSETIPDADLMNVLQRQEFELRVLFLQGSVFNDFDLDRANLQEASSCFFLAAKMARNQQLADAETLIKILSIQKYFYRKTQQNPKICVQFIQEASLEPFRHLCLTQNTSDGIPLYDYNAPVVCVETIKNQLLTKSTSCPGVIAFIANLVVTSDEGLVGANNSGVCNAPWLDEYVAGCQYEIYRSKLPDNSRNLFFRDFAMLVYLQTDTLLIGLEIFSRKNPTDSYIVLNPEDFKIPDIEEHRIYGIVIAESEKLGDISNFGKSPDTSDGTALFSVMAKGVHLGSNKLEPVMETRNFTKSKSASSEVIVHRANKLKVEVLGKVSKRAEMVPDTPTSAQLAHFKPFEYDLDKNSLGGPEYVISSLRMEYAGVKNHLVFCGSFVNLLLYLKTLRQNDQSPDYKIPVVALIDEQVTESSWRCDAGIGVKLHFLYIVHGSPLHSSDLYRVGITYAKAAILLVAPDLRSVHEEMVEHVVQNDSMREHLWNATLDADGIFAFQGIKRINPEINLVIEVLNASNIMFLDSLLLDDKQDEIEMTSRHLLAGPVKKESKIGRNEMDEASWRSTGVFASGRVFTVNLLDALTVKAFYTPEILKICQHLIGDNSNYDKFDQDPYMQGLFSGSRQSTLQQIDAPPFCSQKSYAFLFKYLMKELNCIPVGIYRGIDGVKLIGRLGNSHHYVFTNPPQDTMIFRDDKIFVLAATRL